MAVKRVEVLTLASLGVLFLWGFIPESLAWGASPQGITYEGALRAPLGLALGGLGTSTLEIGRDGAFQNIRLQNDWTENIPRTPAGTFLSVHARSRGQKGVGRVLQLAAPGELEAVRGLTYTGRFPLVQVAYQDPGLPCQVSLEAFSPFVPGDAAASSLPLVFFTFRLQNPGPSPVTAAVALSWVNDITAETAARGWPARGNRNTVVGRPEPAVLMDTRAAELARSEYLLACLPAPGVRYRAVGDWWKEPGGRWLGPNVKVSEVDALARWRIFLGEGRLPPQSVYDDGLEGYSPHRPVAAVSGEVELAPGEAKEVRFALAWFFPYHWDRRTTKANILLGHQYVTRFPGGTRAVADYAFAQRDALRQRSLAWRTLIEESSLPPHCRALTCEILYLLPRISWWLADGTFVLHESINCPRIHPTLLDIYTAPVMAALFPELHANSLRTIGSCQLASGEIPSTLGVWSIHQHEYRLFNSGDASVFPIVVAWEALWGGDPKFQQEMYPVVKKVLQWGERELDADRDGVVDVHGIDQGWDTFPMFGAAAYIADQWIAALMAGETLARRQGDADFARWCSAIRKKASATAENVLWNGKYYDLAHDPVTGRRSSICFADQFTYGTVAANLLGLGEVHPRDRVCRSLQEIWRLNVKPCEFVCRMGSNADGTPADCSSERKQKGGPSQSNSFTPANTAPLAAAALQYGMIDDGLALAEATADVIIHRVKGPWSAELLFDSRTGRCFYGLHYSDCLILWDVMYAMLGVQLDAAQHSLRLAPPRVPVKAPIFGKLYTGQVEFTVAEHRVGLRLINFASAPTTFRTLSVRLPEGTKHGKCLVDQGTVGTIEGRAGEETVLRDVVIAPGGALRLRWE
jgi:uncharacterized protein (DUF608 family)